MSSALATLSTSERAMIPPGFGSVSSANACNTLGHSTLACWPRSVKTPGTAELSPP